MKRLQVLFLALLLVGTIPVAAQAQNVLVNPGFESGPTGGGAAGWITFGNVYTEASNPPQFVPYEGNQVVSMFGNFSGGFNVTGMFQEFPTSPGAEWNLSCKTRHFSGDAMMGMAGTGNWVVQKIVFKDAGDNELPGAVESTVLDGTFPTDVWHENAVISAVAPVGTVQIEAFILYLQPLFDGGAAHIDNVELTQTPVSVALDIHPGSCPNPVNLKAKGALPVAIMGSADFDVSMIDVSTVQLAGVPAGKGWVDDVGAPAMGGDCACTTDGPDGYPDLSLKFVAQDVVEALQFSSFKEEFVLTLTGYLVDGTPIVGADCVVLVGAPKVPVGGELGAGSGSAIAPLSLDVRKDGNSHRIQYRLAEPGEVTLSVFDVGGRLVERLVQAYEADGEHTLFWNGSSHPRGVYFYQLRQGREAVTRKVTLLPR